MALTLVVETGAGLADANAYADVAEADAYHEGRLHAESWTRTPDTRKAQALVWASRLLDAHVEWKGAKSVSDSALRWPRVGVRGRDGLLIASNVVPPELKHATADLARLLLDDDRTEEDAAAGFRHLSIGGAAGLEIEPDPATRRRVLPESVAALIRPLGTPQAGAPSVRLLRS